MRKNSGKTVFLSGLSILRIKSTADISAVSIVTGRFMMNLGVRRDDKALIEKCVEIAQRTYRGIILAIHREKIGNHI